MMESMFMFLVRLGQPVNDTKIGGKAAEKNIGTELTEAKETFLIRDEQNKSALHISNFMENLSI